MSASQRRRGRAWRVVREKRYALARGKCEACGHELRPGWVAHHVRPVHTHPHLELDVANVRALHWSCHKLLRNGEGDVDQVRAEAERQRDTPVNPRLAASMRARLG